MKPGFLVPDGLYFDEPAYHTIVLEYVLALGRDMVKLLGTFLAFDHLFLKELLL